MIKNIFVLLILLASAQVFAEPAVRVGETGLWKADVLKKKNELLGNTEILITLPNDKPGAFVPTVLGERLPVVAIPQSTEEWHQLIFNNVKTKMSTFEERSYNFGSEVRYFIEYATDQGSENTLHTMLFATSINGEIFVFSFSNHRNTFLMYRKAVRNLFRTMTVSLEKGEK